jgi:hypothetical protein
MSGTYPDTPEGSEVDELEYANGVADRLFYLAITGQIGDKPYIKRARWLDSIPGAGEYFRALCMKEFTDKERRDALCHGAWVMESNAQRNPFITQGWVARQWAKPKGTLRVKGWR